MTTSIFTHLKRLAIVASLMLFLDFLYLSATKHKWNQLVNIVQGSRGGIAGNYMAGVFTYSIMVIGLYYLVLKDAPSKPPLGSEGCLSNLRKAAMLGLLVYGVFDGTNMVLFKNWSTQMAVMDTLWGTFLFTVVARIYMYLV